VRPRRRSRKPRPPARTTPGRRGTCTASGTSSTNHVRPSAPCARRSRPRPSRGSPPPSRATWPRSAYRGRGLSSQVVDAHIGPIGPISPIGPMQEATTSPPHHLTTSPPHYVTTSPPHHPAPIISSHTPPPPTRRSDHILRLIR